MAKSTPIPVDKLTSEIAGDWVDDYDPDDYRPYTLWFQDPTVWQHDPGVHLSHGPDLECGGALE